MTTVASQITSLTIVYSIVYSDQRKHQSSASLAFVRGIHRDRWIPRTKGQLRGKCFHLMTLSCCVVLHGKYSRLCYVIMYLLLWFWNYHLVVGHVQSVFWDERPRFAWKHKSFRHFLMWYAHNCASATCKFALHDKGTSSGKNYWVISRLHFFLSICLAISDLKSI